MQSHHWVWFLLTAYAFPWITLAWHGPLHRAQEKRDVTQPSSEEYDYVIIGGGTSGLTVGDRLSEDGKYTVLVLEYGYFDPEVNMDPRRMFNITSEVQPNLNGRNFSVGIGCVVGGSSIVNGQKVMRGTRLEYDAWRELGGPNSTWDWEGLYPYFHKAFTFNAPNKTIAEEFRISYNSKFWGDGSSKLYATFGGGTPNPVQKNFFTAMANMPGMTIPEDSGAGQPGLYWYPFSMDNIKWKRSSARTAHWDDIMRPNLEMVVGAKALKIIFKENKAVGVQYISRNDSSVPPMAIKARRHVILAAGTIHTPQILIQSGIGPTSVLELHNITVVQNLPGVGSNFQDHMYIPAINYKWGIEPNGTWPTELTRRQDPPWGLVAPPFLSALFGLPTISPSRYKTLSETFEAQDPVSHLPPTYTKEQIEGYRRQQKIYAKLMREKNSQWNEMMLGQPGGTVQHLHPLSRGLVLPSTNGVNNEMTVDYRALTNPIDLDVVVEEIKFMRRYMLESDLKVFNATETLPGLEVESDEDIGAWAKSTLIPSVFHPVGTAAKMPRKWGGVVDEELSVHGVEGLSIVDASIIPTIVGAPTQMSVYAIAEKAADLIKAKTQHSKL